MIDFESRRCRTWDRRKPRRIVAEPGAVEGDAEFREVRIGICADADGIAVDLEELPEAFVKEASEFGGGRGEDGGLEWKHRKRLTLLRKTTAGKLSDGPAEV